MSDSAAYAWAAVNKDTGVVLRDTFGQYAIYTSKKMALFDCPLYGKIKRVRISTTSNRAKRSHHQK